jgi:hypothetical protein
MSALGQKQTSRREISMPALPPKADIAGEGLRGIARRFGVDPTSTAQQISRRFASAAA